MKPLSLRYLLTFFLLFYCQCAICCINEYRAQLDGKLTLTDAGSGAPYGHVNLSDKAYLSERLHKADSIYKATGNLEDYSDYGAMLIYVGELQKAKKVFCEIEQESPGLYATAANIGTIYELLGLNDSAYYWIDKAIKINPNSHFGSEWIHLKILEAKLHAKDDKDYYLNHSVLSLDFGDAEAPVNNGNIQLKALSKQIYYQLGERMSFIKPKDPIVAQLLFDLGNIEAIISDVQKALYIYESAEKYGYSSELLTKRKNHFTALQKKANFRNAIEQMKRNPLPWLLLGILLIALATVVIARISKKRVS